MTWQSSLPMSCLRSSLQLLMREKILPQIYNVRLIMYLKQFQDITLFERPAKVFQLLEKCMAKHKMSSYIILGDKRNAMDEIFVKRGYFRKLERRYFLIISATVLQREENVRRSNRQEQFMIM